MAAANPADALDTGFSVLSRLTDDAGTAEELWAVTQRMVDQDPGGVECALFAAVVELSEDPDLRRFYEEWKDRKWEHLHRRREGAG